MKVSILDDYFGTSNASARVVEVLRVRHYSELFGQKHFDDSRSTV